MSGAAVWGIVPPNSVVGTVVWSPAAALRVVGLQHAYLKTSYIRCHQWWLIARMFEQIEPELGALFLAALGMHRVGDPKP